jgi:hypothetical protein
VDGPTVSDKTAAPRRISAATSFNVRPDRRARLWMAAKASASCILPRSITLCALNELACLQSLSETSDVDTKSVKLRLSGYGELDR